MYLVDKNLGEPLDATRLRLKEVKADPFSLGSLIAWLETKPADEVYCYTDVGNCLLSQYVASKGGYADHSKFVGIYRIGAHALSMSHMGDGEGDLHRISCAWPQTFGAALTRAQAALERLSQSNPQRGEI